MSLGTPGPHPCPKPDPSDRPAVVRHAYHELYARAWQWQAEYGLTLLELQGCLMRAAGALNAVPFRSEWAAGRAARAPDAPTAPGRPHPSG